MAGKLNRALVMVNMSRRNFIRTGLIFVPTAYAQAQLATQPCRRKAFASSGSVCTGYPCTVPDLAYRFKAGFLTLNDGDLVSSWTDPVGGKVATASGTARPTFKTNIFGSGSVLRFNGSSNIMNISGGGITFVRTSGATLIIVASLVTAAGNKSFTDGCYISPSNELKIVDTNAHTFASNPLSVVQQMITVQYGTSTTVDVSSNKNGANTLGPTYDGDFFFSCIGSYCGSSWFNSDLAELLFYTRRLTLTERNNIFDNYAQAEYSL